jgi:hypothetical protein
MKKLLIFFIMVFMMATLVSAQVETLGIFKQSQCVELKQTCGNCTFVNVSAVSLTGTNSATLLTDATMTKDGTRYNYTFCNTGALGTYIVDTVGDVDGTYTVASYDFEVNATGYNLGVFPIQFIFIILGFFLIATGKFNKTLNLFKTMGAIILMIMGVLTLFPGYAGIDHTTLLGLGVGFILIGSGFYFMVEGVFENDHREDYLIGDDYD